MDALCIPKTREIPPKSREILSKSLRNPEINRKSIRNPEIISEILLISRNPLKIVEIPAISEIDVQILASEPPLGWSKLVCFNRENLFSPF